MQTFWYYLHFLIFFCFCFRKGLLFLSLSSFALVLFSPFSCLELLSFSQLYIHTSLPLSTVCMLSRLSLSFSSAGLFVSPLCVNVLFCVSSASPLSRSPWWRGGAVATVLLCGRHLKLLLPDSSSSLVFYNTVCHHNWMYSDFLL